MPAAKTAEERAAAALHAEERSAHWLMVYNDLNESGKGDTQRAKDAYDKSARWLMKANELRGW